MAVATKPRRPSSKKKKPASAKRPAKPGKNGKMKAAGPGKFAAEQKPLASMEDVDERIPALDEKCQKAIADRERQRSAAQDFAEDLEEIGELLKEHNLECYIISGKKFVPVPGEPTVKIYKVKQG
jgi:hypothetical protein